MSKPATSLRLDRLLSNLGYGSRREIQELVRAEGVTYDGQTLADAAFRIPVAPDLPTRLRIGGQQLDPPPGLTLMLHKPLGVTCSHKDSGALVYDLFPSRWRRREPPLSSIGRLDKETSGLLLFTDDGDLLHRVISPRSHVSKRYFAILAKPLRGDEAQVFASGELLLDGEVKPLAPARLEVLADVSAYLTIFEGRYHQVRRMFAAVDNHVLSLHRDKIGGLVLPGDLEAGRHRILQAPELARLWTSDP